MEEGGVSIQPTPKIQENATQEGKDSDPHGMGENKDPQLATPEAKDPAIYAGKKTIGIYGLHDR